MDVWVISLLNGISFGTVLFLLASGLSLILGVMGILNLTHGALYMIGAYVGWSLAEQYGFNFGMAVLASGVSAGLIGLVIERIFLRHLYRQLNEQVLLTFGFVYIITNLTQWVWGPVPRAPFTASFLSGSFNIGIWSYPAARISIILIGLVLAVGLWWLQDRTRVGAIVRAGMDDKEMTMGLGINLGRVSTAVFFLGAFIAGCAGIIGAQLLGAHLLLSTDILLLALVVVIVGGVGSVQGALLGAMLIGIIDAFGKALFPELAMFMIYLVMIIILLIKPTGLMGKKGI
jgi:branched-chain amino acid transport system permease protein